MSESAELTRDVRSFWNSRAGLGQWAGTRDVIAKQLEVEAIASYVHDGMRVLEIGCGNGITAIELARRHDVDILAIDFAAEMITAAKSMLEGQALKGSLQFQIGDARSLSAITNNFDFIYTERVLINLPDWAAQRQAIHDITAMLANNGAYAMCENSQDGLDELNRLRERIGLAAINAPWHNRYLRDADLEQLTLPGIALAEINFYSSTYYLLSRVVNAALAVQEGKDPDYEAPVNLMALRLPSVGTLGQGRIWLWRRVDPLTLTTPRIAEKIPHSVV